jgi:hypothetical protein
VTDLEITILCAKAMGLDFDYDDTDVWFGTDPDSTQCAYYPLKNDAQTMALVKKFVLVIRNTTVGWYVESVLDGIGDGVRHNDLNRAICECVAKMQAAK